MARHPLQRLSSPSRTSSLLLHALGIASFSYNFDFLNKWDTPIARSYGSHYQFLTILGLSASLIAFILGLLSDLTLNHTLFQAKNAFVIIAAPLEVVISVLYWGIRAIDPELLVQDGFELPFLTDLGFHFAPAVFLTADLVLFSPPWAIPGYAVMMMSTALAFGYWYWVELCFSVNGWYPYPIFGLLSTTQRALLFTLAGAIATTSSIGLKWLYGRINGFEVIRKEAHKPLKQI